MTILRRKILNLHFSVFENKNKKCNLQPNRFQVIAVFFFLKKWIKISVLSAQPAMSRSENSIFNKELYKISQDFADSFTC